MIRVYGYPEFKRNLCSNPKWMLRGLVVLAYNPEIATPENIDDIRLWISAIENNDGEMPLDHGEVVDILTQHAPDIYRFYRKRFQVPGTTS